MHAISEIIVNIDWSITDTKLDIAIFDHTKVNKVKNVHSFVSV